VRNATTPTPTSTAGITFDTSNTVNDVVVLTRINPAPPTRYGRSQYSVHRCGAATMTLPLTVVTRLRSTRCLSPD
jgi:hypothetical protein